MVQGERDGDTGNTVKDERRAERLEAPVVGGRKGLAETVTSEANEFCRQKRHPCDKSEVGENGEREGMGERVVGREGAKDSVGSCDLRAAPAVFSPLAPCRFLASSPMLIRQKLKEVLFSVWIYLLQLQVQEATAIT